MAASSRKRERSQNEPLEPVKSIEVLPVKKQDHVDKNGQAVPISSGERNGAEESDQSSLSSDYLEDSEDVETEDEEEDVDDDESSSADDENTSSFKSDPSVGTSGKVNEYEYDSSDEEDIRNTVGNIPMEWYKDFPHIGYDLSGKKILKPNTGDELDNLINMSENPDYWHTVRDPQTGQDIVLSREDCTIIQRLQAGKYADVNIDPYSDWPDTFEREIEIHPICNRPEDKRSFIPSKWERLKVGKMVHSMKMGWMKPPSQVEKEKQQKLAEPEAYFDLWSNEAENDTSRMKMHIPAPKMLLPGHSESYNPPSEYLFDDEELKKWKDTDPEDRRQNFIPQKFSSMRSIPAYSQFIKERFERCVDLYLCPRQQKMRMNVNPEDLIPKLPHPRDLQPFPTTESIVFKGHEDMVRKISIDPSGHWMVSGSDDKTSKFWEIQTGRCMKTIELADRVRYVAWCPNASLSLVAIACETSVILLNPQLGDKLISGKTDEIIGQGRDEEKASIAEWKETDSTSIDYTEKHFRMEIVHSKPVLQVAWHVKGDYLAVTLNDQGNQSVVIHQLSKRRSQCPFTRSKGLVQSTLFHPSKPFLFVATQRYVRVYNLLKQEMTKKLQASCKWISSMAIHPGGDNLITGSYDCRLHWFDMDLSTKPYQTLKHQKKAIRSVDIHKKYPLFASTSDDGSVVVCHGMVYNDLMQNPLIVPVKVLRGHGTAGGLSVIDCQFHPVQPWLLTSGADGTIRLFS